MHECATYVAASERLLLRPLTRADLPVIGRWFSDERIRRFYLLTEEGVGADTLAEAIEWARHDPDVAAWAIEERDGTLAGLGNWRADPVFRDVYEIEVTLGPHMPGGRGYGTEAHALVLDHLMRTRPAAKVTGRALADNHAVIALAARLGFVEEGRLRRHVQIGKERVDLVVVGILREEWERSRQARPYATISWGSGADNPRSGANRRHAVRMNGDGSTAWCTPAAGRPTRHAGGGS